MDDFLKGLFGIVAGAFGLAIISVIVAPGAQTSKVVDALGSGLSNVIKAAVSPITSPNNGNLGNNSFTTPNLAASLSSLAASQL